MGSSKGKPFVFQPPPVKHLPDIQKLFWVGKKLWVFTSTVEKENGVLVDVFDGNGNYAGKFYLLIPHVDARFLFRTPLDIDRDRLIIRDVGDDENFIVTVYRLPDNQ